MLTVDRVLEKRRSKIAANRLRNGLPTAARSRWCPSEAERERKIESLRLALMAKSRTDLINYYLLLFDSTSAHWSCGKRLRKNRPTCSGASGWQLAYMRRPMAAT